MPINCLVKCLIKFWTVMFQNQFMVNSWTIHEHSCFKKTPLSSFPLSSSFFLSFPLFSSLRLFVFLSLCLFVFLSFCLFVSSSPSLLLSFPLSSSLFLSLPLFLSFFNVRPAKPANSLKTKELRKGHFWLQIFESRETAKTQNVRRKICPMIRPFPRWPYTPHAARNRPYILRRETLHYVGFHVGFADPILHT